MTRKESIILAPLCHKDTAKDTYGFSCVFMECWHLQHHDPLSESRTLSARLCYLTFSARESAMSLECSRCRWAQPCWQLAWFSSWNRRGWESSARSSQYFLLPSFLVWFSSWRVSGLLYHGAELTRSSFYFLSRPMFNPEVLKPDWNIAIVLVTSTSLVITISSLAYIFRSSI